jgi:transcriptional regulator with GAF, ATPase, and Fis domain
MDDLVVHTVKRIVGEDSDDVARRVVDEIRTQVPTDYAWPGNVRELEQCIRRILLKRNYEIETVTDSLGDTESRLIAGIKEGSMDAQKLLSHYCMLLYDRYGSYEDVARKTSLDRRTVKKYIDQWHESNRR